MRQLSRISSAVLRCYVAASLSGIAAGQVAVAPEMISINDPRPLEVVAETLRSRYGAPISYEDVTTYAYYGDVADPVDFHAKNPNGTLLPPRSSSLQFQLEPLKIGFDPVQPANLASVTTLLQSVLDQHQAHNNPGRFKLLETAGGGLAIVPTATRNTEGVLVPDQSLLDARITFPEVEGDTLLVVWAFRDALGAATGKQIRVDALAGNSAPISANNEPARDVLIRLLNGFHRTSGLVGPEETKLVWNLTTETGSVSAVYHLQFVPIIMERHDAKGQIIVRRIIAR